MNNCSNRLARACGDVAAFSLAAIAAAVVHAAIALLVFELAASLVLFRLPGKPGYLLRGISYVLAWTSDALFLTLLMPCLLILLLPIAYHDSAQRSGVPTSIIGGDGELIVTREKRLGMDAVVSHCHDVDPEWWVADRQTANARFVTRSRYDEFILLAAGAG